MRIAWISMVLSHLSLLVTCQTSTLVSQEIHIPMDVTTSRPIVELTLNGQGPYKFIFDTGSTTHVIDQGLHKELGFKEVGQDSLRTQGSQSKVSPRVAVPKVAFPDTKIAKDVEMSVVNLRAMLPIDGVLSSNFFDDDLITLDYPNSELIIASGELNISENNVSQIINHPQVLSCNMNVAGVRIETHLDTGSPGGFSIPYALKDQLSFSGPPQKGQDIRTPVASYKTWRAELAGTITLGNVNYLNPSVLLVEGFEYANIGFSVIKDLRTTIDRKNHLIRFEKPVNNKALKEEWGETNEFTGWYGGKVRKIYLEKDGMYLQRDATKLKLESIEGDLYKMAYHVPVNNELPNVRFERDPLGHVIGFTFLFQGGKEDFVKKD